MTRVRNLDDFRASLGRLYAAADQVRTTANAGLAARFPRDAESVPANPAELWKDWLECHVRDFFIDRLLGQLNWQKASEVEVSEYVQNMTVEQDADFGVQGVQRPEDERRKRLDYFGFERETDRPLLIVEAKRPSVRLPQGSTAEVADALRKYLVRSRRRQYSPGNAGLPEVWGECLDQVREYARSVFVHFQRWPSRVAVCNGTWLVVFVEPHLAFGTTAAPDVGEILVCESRDAIVQRAGEVWKCLEYGALAGGHSQCLPSEIPFLVDPARIESCMFALKILYARSPSHYARPEPCILVVPALVLRSTGASFLKIGFDRADDLEGEEYELPAGNVPLDGHLNQVGEAALRLKRRVEEVLHRTGHPLPLVNVQTHMADVEAFKGLATVSPIRLRDLAPGELAVLTVTGDEPHFLRRSPEYRDCVHHRHGESQRTHTAQLPHAVARPSMADYSHFTDGSEFHCTHREVIAPKGQPVTSSNRARCGPRSCDDDGAFCELWRFERMLCCRTCVFQRVCLASPVFTPPCPPRPVQVTIGGNVVATVP